MRGAGLGESQEVYWNRLHLRLQLEIPMGMVKRLWRDGSGVQSDTHLGVVSV